jgi:small-conductance mechanosensitive channel
MAQAQAMKEIQLLVTEIRGDLQEVTVLWQLAAIVLSLGIAWAVKHWTAPRLAAIEGRWKSSIEGLERAVFPVSALLCLTLARTLLDEWNPVSLVRLAFTLMATLAIIRVLSYLLRSAFKPSPTIITVERMSSWAVWIGLALHLTGLLPVLTYLLDSIHLPIGKSQVSIMLLLRGAFSVVLTLLITLWIGRLIEQHLMSAHALDINVRVILSKIAKALLIVVGVLIALSVVGIDVTLLSVFGGALGVGLAFGLQKIASNYVSGFIILADRSVAIGDTVNIAGREGIVTRMSSRYVVVRNLDGTEAIIPNETLITSTVINQSYSDRRVRVELALQIAYDSDLEAVIELIRSVAARHPRVLPDPGPSVLVKLFADSGIDLELGVWIDDPDAGRGNLRSDIYRELFKAFREHGIDIPFPQREVRLLGPNGLQAGPVPSIAGKADEKP